MTTVKTARSAGYVLQSAKGLVLDIPKFPSEGIMSKIEITCNLVWFGFDSTFLC